MQKKRMVPWIRSLLVLLALTAAVAVGAHFVGSKASGPNSDELEADLRRAAVHCFAVEGRYPPDLDYLLREYSVSYDKNKFTVVYLPVSSNLMPDITVIDAGEGAGA